MTRIVKERGKMQRMEVNFACEMLHVSMFLTLVYILPDIAHTLTICLQLHFSVHADGLRLQAPAILSEGLCKSKLWDGNKWLRVDIF